MCALMLAPSTSHCTPKGTSPRDLLRQNLGQLRQQLADVGLTTGRFDVGTGSQQNDPRTGTGAMGSATRLPDEDLAPEAAPVESVGRPVPTSGQSVLDMRL